MAAAAGSAGKISYHETLYSHENSSNPQWEARLESAKIKLGLLSEADNRKIALAQKLTHLTPEQLKTNFTVFLACYTDIGMLPHTSVELKQILSDSKKLSHYFQHVKDQQDNNIKQMLSILNYELSDQDANAQTNEIQRWAANIRAGMPLGFQVKDNLFDGEVDFIDFIVVHKNPESSPAVESGKTLEAKQDDLFQAFKKATKAILETAMLSSQAKPEDLKNPVMMIIQNGLVHSIDSQLNDRTEPLA